MQTTYRYTVYNWKLIMKLADIIIIIIIKKQIIYRK